ncbi:MAG: GNAT family N-acetyltransferase [Candidatus Hodarchaeales archaeon]|jgi:GNAT superfamily N-acetyltransferase
MVQQIPPERLMNYWSYFKEKEFKNILAFCLARSEVKDFVDDLKNPDVIMFLIKWACYFTGNSEVEDITEFLVKIPEKFTIYVPTDKWEIVLRRQWKYVGYHQCTEFSAKNLSLMKIQRFLNPLPEGFLLKRVDVETAKQILVQNLSDHWIGAINYLGGPQKFVSDGIGYCVKEGDKIVGMVMGVKASIPITKSIELDISILPEYRGRGFATILSAKLIEHCLKEKIEPHWETGSSISFKLAKKLGYEDPKPYRYYYWQKEPWTISELRNTYDSQFKRGLGKINLLKSEIELFIKSKQDVEVSNSLLSLLTKTRGIFEEIFRDVNRFLETKIVKEADIFQFKEFVKAITQQLDVLESLKKQVTNKQNVKSDY